MRIRKKIIIKNLIGVQETERKGLDSQFSEPDCAL